jgi:hypothetical protein
MTYLIKKRTPLAGRTILLIGTVARRVASFSFPVDKLDMMIIAKVTKATIGRLNGGCERYYRGRYDEREE